MLMFADFRTRKQRALFELRFQDFYVSDFKQQQRRPALCQQMPVPVSLATKSVWQLTSRMKATLPSILVLITPSAATLPAFFRRF